MIQISTTDNSSYKLKDNELDARDDLSKIANVKIDDNLLVFPQSISECKDKIGENSIISLHGDTVQTGNIMGFVGVNDTQLDIKSRFADKSSGKDYFLHYMLLKVFSINLFDIKHTSSEERVFDFLIYLFPYFLRKAVAQGIFKKYHREERNDSQLRGPIDVSRHIRQNIPFGGNVAYRLRTQSYDNEITQLVRHTIEYLKTKQQGSVILGSDSETRQCVSQIVMATPSYSRGDRSAIVGKNLRPVRHPYFSQYTVLQKICLKILRHETIKFGHEKDKVYGILFDGAWLWEEYLRKTILEPLQFKHAENKTGKNRKYLFKNNSGYCYPDFYHEQKRIVLDAKYKGYSNWDNVQNHDLYQVITYMHILDYGTGGFIVPKYGDALDPKQLNGLGGTMHILRLKVKHDCTDFQEYAKAMQAEENSAVESWGRLG